MNQLVRPPNVTIATSACPHDCPSTCALEVEVLDGRSIGRVRGAEDNLYTAGVICAKVARYAERIHHPDRLLHPLVRTGPKGSGPVCADLVGRRARPHRREAARRRGEARQRSGVALLLRRHDGPGDARRHQPPAPREEIFRLPFHHLRQSGLDRLHRRHRQARRSRSARDGALRPGGDLGHQSGQHAGQRDDPRDPRPQGTRRQDRRDRHLPERHHAAGRPRRAGAARHRRRARLRGDALPVPRRLRRPRLSGKIHRRAARAGRARAHALARMGREDHRLPGRDHRGVRAPRRRAQARLLPSRLRLRPLAQRHHQHACGELHRGGARLMGAGRRRRVPQQRRDLSLEQDHHRRARRARSVDPHARPVAHRADSVRRARRAGQRHAGDGAVHPEHQSAVGRARAGQGEARLCARRSVRVRARAVHDRDGADGRRGAPRDDVHGARRHVSGRRAPIHPARPEADRSAGRMPLQPRRDLRAGAAPRRASIRASP